MVLGDTDSVFFFLPSIFLRRGCRFLSLVVMEPLHEDLHQRSQPGHEVPSPAVRRTSLHWKLSPGEGLQPSSVHRFKHSLSSSLCKRTKHISKSHFERRQVTLDVMRVCGHKVEGGNEDDCVNMRRDHAQSCLYQTTFSAVLMSRTRRQRLLHFDDESSFLNRSTKSKKNHSD